MQRFLLLFVLVAAGLGGVPTDALAGHRSGPDVQTSLGRGGAWYGASCSGDHDRNSRDRYDRDCSSRDRYSPRACDHRHAAAITRVVWVPATFRNVVVGYSHCGQPRYDRVRVPRHRETIVTGHRCNSCGASC